MQDVQNIPNPDVNYIEDGGDFGSHSGSDAPNPNVEQPNEESPTTPDRLPNPAVDEPPTSDGADAPIEEPPTSDESGAAKQIV